MPDREAAYKAVRALARCTLPEAVADAAADGKTDIETLAAVARSEWWAWAALARIAPDRAATIPITLSKRGQAYSDNTIRDTIICAEVQHRMGEGVSLRAACRATAGGYPEFGNEKGNAWKAVAAVWRKRPNK